jgi:hypothetical protein
MAKTIALLFRNAPYIKDKIIGRGNEERLVEIIAERAKSSDELSHILANGLLKANENSTDINKALIAMLPSLVDANRGNMRRIVTPIGRSCVEMKHFSGSENEFYISEPDAEAIRSKDKLEVDDMKNYECYLISELNTKTGNCHLHLIGMDKYVVGKINDPILKEAKIYIQNV